MARTSSMPVRSTSSRNGGASGWRELVRLQASDPQESQHFGEEVGISGGTLVTGAPLDDELGFRAGAAYLFQVEAKPAVMTSGACPGEMTMSVSGATPSSPVLVAGSPELGETLVPVGDCVGAELDLEEARLLFSFTVDSEGQRRVRPRRPRIPSAVSTCRGWTGSPCGVGPVETLPR